MRIYAWAKNISTVVLALVTGLSCLVLVFTARHGMQTRSYDEISVRLSVRLSVCLSVKRVHCDKTEESNV